MQVTANVVDKVHRKSWEGKDWLVVPTVMIKEGVLNGEYVSAEELRKFPSAWNGRPFVIEHPKDGATAVSANDPKVMDTYRAGYIFGTEYSEEDQSVPAEIWLDIKRAEKLSGGPELMRRILDGKPVEVSTGYFRDLEERGGEWDGKAYQGIAKNLRPDHLAALLESTGACSWEDGCGCPRTNECEEENCSGKCSDRLMWTEPSELVYQANKEAELGDTPKDSQTTVKSALLKLASAIGISIDQGVETMANKAEMVTDLCARLKLNADDAEAGLSTLSEDTLRAILVALADTAKKPDDEEDEDKKDEEKDPIPNTEEDKDEEPQANEQACADARFEVLEKQIADLVQQNADLAIVVETAMPVVKLHQEAQASEKAKLVGTLATNERCAFDKTELEAMDVPTLNKLARSLVPTNYVGQAGVPMVNMKTKDDRPVVPWNSRAGKEK